MLQTDLIQLPEGFVSWLIVGLAVGALAGTRFRADGSGPAWDALLGLLGAVFGGFLFRLHAAGDPHPAGCLLAALAGAGVLLAVTRLLGRTAF